MCQTVHELANMTQAQPVLTGASYVMPVHEHLALFDVHAMSSHLKECLEAGKLTPFPNVAHDVGPRRLRRKDIIRLAVTVEVM